MKCIVEPAKRACKCRACNKDIVRHQWRVKWQEGGIMKKYWHLFCYRNQLDKRLDDVTYDIKLLDTEHKDYMDIEGQKIILESI